MRKLVRKSQKPAQISRERDAQDGGKLDTYDGGLFLKRYSGCFVGIDASLTHHAIAAISEDGKACFIWVFRPNTTPPMTFPQQVRRLIYINQYVYNTLHTLKVQTGGVRRITIEGYSYGSKQNREVLGEGGGATKTAIVRALGFVEENAYPLVIATTTVKMFATGYGRADKDQMIKSVQDKYGIVVKDDNAADALTLAHIAKMLYSGSASLQDYEVDALKNIERHYPEWAAPKKKLSNQTLKPSKKILQRKPLKKKPMKLGQTRKVLSESRPKQTRIRSLKR